MNRAAFVLEHTRLQRPPLVPELRLRLADEVMPLWRTMEQDAGGLEVPPPLWAFAWAGGQAVARYVLDHPKVVAGKRVLDFASGSGLCAIAAMVGGARSALAVDIDGFALEAVAINAQVNGAAVEVTDNDLLDADPPDIDLILAGDVFYEQPLAGRVLSWLQVAHQRGVDVLIGDPGRAYFPRDIMTQLAQYDVPTMRELEGVEVKKAGVFAFRSERQDQWSPKVCVALNPSDPGRAPVPYTT